MATPSCAGVSKRDGVTNNLSSVQVQTLRGAVRGGAGLLTPLSVALVVAALQVVFVAAFTRGVVPAGAAPPPPADLEDY